MNSFDPTSLLRPAIRNLRGFCSARDATTDLTLQDNLIRLDANENPWPPEGAFAAACHVNRYPEAQPTVLKNLLANLYQIAPEQILLCRGSEDIPDLLIRCFCQPTREGVVICPPTFGMYEVAANINEATQRFVTMRAEKGYDLNVAAILNGWQAHEKILFMASPTAPMGNLIPSEQITALLKGLAGRAMVVVDEAYIEFAEHPGWARHLENYPNLLVLRTLSKGYALAGTRLGALLAAPSLIDKLKNVLPPYPIPAPTIEIVRQALGPIGLKQLAERRQIIVHERRRLAQALAQKSSVKKIFASDANFLLIETESSADFVKMCLAKGVVVRNRHSDIPNTVRITVGTPEENDFLLQAVS